MSIRGKQEEHDLLPYLFHLRKSVFAVALLMLACSQTQLVSSTGKKKGGDSGDQNSTGSDTPSAKPSDKPTDQPEGVPGYLIDPDMLATINASGTSFVITSPAGNVGCVDCKLTDVKVRIGVIPYDDLRKDNGASTEDITLLAEHVSEASPNEDGSFSITETAAEGEVFVLSLLPYEKADEFKIVQPFPELGPSVVVIDPRADKKVENPEDVYENGGFEKKPDETTTNPDPSTNLTCAGRTVGGFCWYLADWNQSCDEFCSNHGGFSEDGTVRYAGSAGTDAQCLNVLEGLGAGAGEVSEWPTCGGGCGIGIRNKRRRDPNTATTASCAENIGRRACACQE